MFQIGIVIAISGGIVAPAVSGATIYRCTDENGIVTFSETVCGDKERVAVGTTASTLKRGKRRNTRSFGSMQECRAWAAMRRRMGEIWQCH
jgi:hypothetical protein